MFLQLFLILLGLYLIYNFYWKRRNLPPGPIPFPILGNVIEMFRKPVYQAGIDWHNKYGPIYTAWIGEIPMVVITDYNLINETLVKDADSYAGRPQLSHQLTQSYGGIYGVINTEGDFWRDQRRFTLHVFRNFGLGKNLMQERVLDEVSSLIENIRTDISNGANEHNIAMHIDIAVGSIINNLLFNYRFANERLNEFHKLKKVVSNLMKHAGNPFLAAFREHTEVLEYIPILRNSYHALKNSKEELYEFYKNQVEEHQKRVDHDSEPTDFVEAFLREKAKKDEEGSGEAHYYTKLQLLNMCADLWLAGQETTSNTLGWGILYLMQEQEIQEKLQNELDFIIGSDRVITMDDRPKLHYTNAVVNEIQRIANLLNGNVPHTTTRDVKINGYDIAKGTIIIPNISVVLYDEKYFPNPRKFDPTRFLDDKGRWKRVDELIPFSVGKRQCLGEGLARMELFLFTANIFNQFRIKSISSKPPDMSRKLGGTISPQPFVCFIEKRH